MDVYAAREGPRTGRDRCDDRRAAVPLPAERGELQPSWSEGGGRGCRPVARPGDLVLTVGAGDVTMLAREILHELRERAG
jgi:UDP-N-acetylmuramate--alanine ligase